MEDFIKPGITKNKTEPFTTSSSKINKASKTNASSQKITKIVQKFNEEGEKVLLRGGSQFAGSQYDELYKNSKKFKTFYDEAYDTPWNEAQAYQKDNAARSFKVPSSTHIVSLSIFLTL